MANTIADMLVMETAEPDRTLTSIDVFGEKSKDFDDMISGGKNIFGQEVAPLSQVELLEMIMPFGGSIRGGKVAKSTFSQLNKLAGKYLDNVRSSRRFKDIADFEAYNKLSKTRIQKQKALDKYGIADPDKQEFVDSISALLSKWSKN